MALGLYDSAIADYSDAMRLDPTDEFATAQRKAAYAAKESPPDTLAEDLSDCGITPDRQPLLAEAAGAADWPEEPRPPLRLELPAATSSDKVFSPLAVTGFSLGLVSVVFYAIGLIPILGIVFSAIGLGKFDPQTQKAKWMAGVGLALSILYTFMFLSHH